MILKCDKMLTSGINGDEMTTAQGLFRLARPCLATEKSYLPSGGPVSLFYAIGIRWDYRDLLK